MKDYVQEHLKETRKLRESIGKPYQEVRPALKCADGTTLSIQASEFHYCSPRQTDMKHYYAVEVGFPSCPPSPSWREYAEDWPEGLWKDLSKIIDRIVQGFKEFMRYKSTLSWRMAYRWAVYGRACETVYAWIPIELVNEFIEEHGGPIEHHNAMEE